jgi:hypothetical protein
VARMAGFVLVTSVTSPVVLVVTERVEVVLLSCVKQI